MAWPLAELSPPGFRLQLLPWIHLLLSDYFFMVTFLSWPVCCFRGSTTGLLCGLQKEKYVQTQMGVAGSRGLRGTMGLCRQQPARRMRHAHRVTQRPARQPCSTWARYGPQAPSLHQGLTSSETTGTSVASALCLLPMFLPFAFKFFSPFSIKKMNDINDKKN